MLRSIVVLPAAVLLLIATAGSALAQEGAGSLVSSWTLAALEQNPGAEDTSRVPGPHGLLILDGAGNVFEFFGATRRDAAGSPQGESGSALDDFGGFWGRYTVDEAAGAIAFAAADGVSPSVAGLAFSRRFELDGDRLTMISGDEPQAQGHKRFTWQRVPTVANLTPGYREIVGFWQHVVERQVNPETGEVRNERERAPSVIVYTPGGFVGVHFPGLGREAPATDTPTAEEARAALRGYIGYFGTLGVYPGEVFHNILAGVAPGAGSILRRYARIDGDELVVTLQSGAPRTDANRPQFVTEVVLHRLSDADDMLPPGN
jgi:hypothetical protein